MQSEQEAVWISHVSVLNLISDPVVWREKNTGIISPGSQMAPGTNIMLTALSLDNLLWQMVRLYEEYTYMWFAKYDKTCKNSSVCFFRSECSLRTQTENKL